MILLIAQFQSYTILYKRRKGSRIEEQSLTPMRPKGMVHAPAPLNSQVWLVSCHIFTCSGEMRLETRELCAAPPSIILCIL